MPDYTTTFETILAKHAANIRLTRLTASTARKFKLTTQASLEKVNALAFQLYIHGDLENAYAVCQLVNNVSFTGNFNLWSWVELTLALQAHILKRWHQFNPAQQIIAQLQAIYTDTHHQILNRRLNGNLLHTQAIADAIKSQDRQLERDYRLADLYELVFISNMGAVKPVFSEQIQDHVSYFTSNSTSTG